MTDDETILRQVPMNWTPFYSPLLSSCCWICFNKRECIAVIFINSVWTELSFAMLRPLLELDFIRLTKISTCIFKVATNSSISVLVSPFSWWCCWNNTEHAFRYNNQKNNPDIQFWLQLPHNIPKHFYNLPCSDSQFTHASKQTKTYN